MGFYNTIDEAIADIEAHGFDTQARIDDWMARIEAQARAALVPEAKLQAELSSALSAIYTRLVDNSGIMRTHPGVDRLGLSMIKPRLRSELDRRIMASANLITLNRQQMIAKTLQRFSGWATSIPQGGSKAVDKGDVKVDLKKAMKSLPYEERRVMVDQSHKLVSSINEIVAVDGGAIAAEWHSHFRQAGYHYRPDHKERDGHVFLIRGNWAQEKGFCKVGSAGYSDAITAPGEEVFCFPGDLEVPFADGVTKAYRRWYDGEMTEIITASGETLRGTPNHPILTSNGWVALGALQKGDQVAEISVELRKSFKENQNNRIATISEIFASLQEHGVTQTLNLRPADFHGDGSNGNVDVVFSAWGLAFGMNPYIGQGIDEFELPESNGTASAIRALQLGVNRLGLPTQGIMSSSSASRSGGGSHLPHAHDIGGAPIANADVIFYEVSPKSGSTNPKFIAQSKQAFSSGIRFAQVVDIKRLAFSGHVYNLQTKDEWYVASAIIAHNCRCQYRYIYSLNQLPDDMVTAKGRAALSATNGKKTVQ